VTVIFKGSQIQERSASDREEKRKKPKNVEAHNAIIREQREQIQAKDKSEQQEIVKQIRSDIGRITASTLININCRHIDF
jgi:uncharacterized surface protein with fasciclin (FAS1) repeats